MRAKDADAIHERLTRVEELLDRVDRGVEKIELVTVIREPGTGVAADAYNGLRKQIIAAAAERNAHLAQLAQFDDAVRGRAGVEDLHSLTREWLVQAALVVVEDVAQAPEAFDFVGEGDGTPIVRRPAYVDTMTGRTIRMGVAERGVAEPPVAVAVEVASDAAPATDEEDR